jgi:branched-chain amino acid transport system substrate-binding protein
MKRVLIAAAALAAALPAYAQQTVKIGIILPYSGQFADGATQLDNGVKLYVQQKGDTVAGRKIEFVRKDTGGIAPDVAKRLAQELVVRDKVDILAGFLLTPNAMAAGDVSAEARKFMVVMNAATSIITTKSPFMARTSLTTPQLNESLGAWAATKGSIKNIYTMVSDYGPGHDAEQAFIGGFKAAGGNVVGSVRFPTQNPDFSAFVQRAKDQNPGALYVWIPGGAQPAALGKALSERGIDARKTKVLGQLELTSDEARKAMGEISLGMITSAHYDANFPGELNKQFVAGFTKLSGGRLPNFFAIGGYDGMHLIYEVLKKTGGKTDGQAMIDAAKGMKWTSPRGPMSIDPETRDVVQTVYVQRVEKVGGELKNVIIDKVENVKDPVKERMKKK